MRTLLIGCITIYQNYAPSFIRGRCIFRESCSNYVLRQTIEGGFAVGCAALAERIKKCRGGFISVPPSDLYPNIANPIILADGSIVDAAEMKDGLV